MRKALSLLLAGSMALSASALTINDLAGEYELQYAYGSVTYIAEAGTTTFGLSEGDTEANAAFINKIKVTTDGEYLYFSNFLNLTCYGEVDLDAMTVTLPVQYVTAATGYSFTQCLYESTMFGSGDEGPTFDEANAQAIVLNITENGDLSLWQPATADADGYWNYIAYWGWGKNYGWLTGIFHKTGELTPNEETAPIIGTYTCKEFAGEWCSIWGEWNDEWYSFDITTNEGIDRIGVDPGEFEVNINSLGDNEVEINGLWWGGLTIQGTYDAATKVITFPLQTVWGGYLLCNSSLCDVEVPTEGDVVPATAVFNEDGTVTMNYTVSYLNYAYLYADQTLVKGEASVKGLESENIDGVAEYYNLQGLRVNPEQNGIYIVREGNKVSKKVIR